VLPGDVELVASGRVIDGGTLRESPPSDRTDHLLFAASNPYVEEAELAVAPTAGGFSP
jgi:hypothetical protein